MPDNLPPASEPVMTHGKEVVGLRPAVKGTSGRSTVELMAGSGLKYVHALNMADRGIEGDLEKSRNQVYENPTSYCPRIIIVLCFMIHSY